MARVQLPLLGPVKPTDVELRMICLVAEGGHVTYRIEKPPTPH